MTSVVMRRGAFCLFQSAGWRRQKRAHYKWVVMRRGAFCLFQFIGRRLVAIRGLCRNAPRRILSISMLSSTRKVPRGL